MTTQHTLNISNVFGPPKKVTIAGHPCETIRFAINTMIPTMTIVSYNNEIFTSLTVDQEDHKDVHLLPKLFLNALVLLAKEARVDVPRSVLVHSKVKD